MLTEFLAARRYDLAVARLGVTSRRRITATAVLGLLLALPIANAPQASASTRDDATHWSHPKAHAWFSHNSLSIDDVSKHETSLYFAMQVCPTGNHYKCGLPSGHPQQWPLNIVSSRCEPLLSSVLHTKGVRRVPNKTAQRLWSTALEDDTQACTEIKNAATLNEAKARNGSHVEAQHDGEIAADDAIVALRSLA